ncbi:hypothetical protein HC891_04265 [Candidatus Gracilibacteria bacterium]|nr:hypothetical protein [Candidatus Gracilibacteria bacterium]
MLRSLGLLLLALGLLGGVAFLLPHLVGFEALRFTHAESQWQRRSFADYRATLQHRYVSGGLLPTTKDCSVAIEVRAGTVHRVGGDCPETLTIDTLFSRFKPYVGEDIPSRHCGYGGCSCAVNTFAAEYDTALGYPTRIARDLRDVTPGSGAFGRVIYALPQPARSWLLNYLEERSPCTSNTQTHAPAVTPIDREEIIVRSLTPL